MGLALMKGIAGKINIGFSDTDTEKVKSAAATIRAAVFSSNTEAAEKGNYIFLAVKPQIMERVLAEISPVLRKRLKAGDAPVLVSMAAGWNINKIQAAAGGSVKKIPVVRIMPNTPALVSKGMIALSASPEVPPEKIDELETMLKGAGVIDRIDENYLNAVTGLSGSGPAFVYLFIEALADGGVLAGMPRDKALRYAAQTVLGAAAMVLETGKHPGELKDMVTSPGGTTIAGIAELEAGGFRSLTMEAVRSAWHRAKELTNGN